MAPGQIHTHGLKPQEAHFLNWVHPEVEALIAKYGATDPARKDELERAARNFGVAYIEERERELSKDQVYVVTWKNGEPEKVEKRNRSEVECHCCKWDLNMRCIWMCCP
jgi:hypothetical protein